ncbi:MAG: hypothetical protein KJ717_01695 [Proteobacteria bacterium]|nr:hypothetical protein [Pseudomonadota bacterium]
MQNIIKFPTKKVRDNVLIEKCIKEILNQTPADENIKNEITKRSLEIWNKYQCEFPPISIKIPENIAEKDRLLIEESIKNGFEIFESSLHDHMNIIILERIQTEIKLYFLESGT